MSDGKIGLGDLTEKQHATIRETLTNYYWTRRYDVSIRSSGDAVLHLYDEEGDTVFAVKVSPEGAYC